MTAADSRRVRVLYEQFHVLRAEAEKIDLDMFEKPGSLHVGASVVAGWFNRLLEQAKALLADDSALAASIAAVQPLADVRVNFHAVSHKIAREEIIVGTSMVLQALAPLLMGSGGSPAISVEREGMFLPGRHFDAMQLAWKILSQAQSSIVIVDGYIDHKILELLKGKGESVRVSILTKPTLPGEIAPLASAFNRQYGQAGALAIRTSTDFHDRFVIIDDSDLYHFGASLKDLGTRGSMFSRIEEPAVTDMLRRQFAEAWEHGKIIV